MSILSNLFGGGGRSRTNPANAAMPYLNQIPSVGHDYFDPFVKQGQEADARLNNEFINLYKDPTGFINKIMESYKPSEAYQFNRDELQKVLGSTAAAGGYRGTDFDQQQQAKYISGLLSQDEQQFLQNALGAYNTGLEGEKGFSNRGFTASGNLADIIGGSLNQRGGLAFQGQSQINANKAGLISALLKALGVGTGLAAGGGAFGNLASLASGGLGSDMFGGG